MMAKENLTAEVKALDWWEPDFDPDEVDAEDFPSPPEVVDTLGFDPETDEEFLALLKE